MLTKIQNFSTLELGDGIFSDTRPAVQQPWQQSDIWIFGYDSISIISKLNTNIRSHEILHPLPKDDDI
jgi:hypothetical protein